MRQNPAFASIHFNGRFAVNDKGNEGEYGRTTEAAGDSSPINSDNPVHMLAHPIQTAKTVVGALFNGAPEPRETYTEAANRATAAAGEGRTDDTVPAVGDPPPTEETPAATDSGLSWGRNGGVESTTERADPQIPTAAEAASGFQGIASAATTSPMPSTLGRPLTPVSGSGARGNWNSSSIFENTKIG